MLSHSERKKLTKAQPPLLRGGSCANCANHYHRRDADIGHFDYCAHFHSTLLPKKDGPLDRFTCAAWKAEAT